MRHRGAASRDEADAFEREVRRIAALLYPGDATGGAAMVAGREHDGIFITDDAAIAIEATTSREKSKAEKDGPKLKSITAQLARSYPYKAVKGFFITQQSPTAAQMDVIRKVGEPVTAISYAKFRARLIDSKGYLDARDQMAFGSARDPETDDFRVRDKYVPLDFIDLQDRKSRQAVSDLIRRLDAGGRVAVVGDFGAGKSMTLREIYLEYRAQHRKRDDARFCLHLNLNKHQGQTDPSEALVRHATQIGFANPHQLVRAWRSGEAHLLLDGFDEVFVPGWATGGRALAEIRDKSVELIRQFVRETPATSGVAIAGRSQFFDTVPEMISALDLPKSALIVSTTDFTEEQVREYLSQRSWTTALPDWLPRRPLLIGYLAARRMLESPSDFAAYDAGSGWDKLLERIAKREARAEAGVDEFTVRRIVERLATLARRTTSGLGPVQFEDLVEVFRDLRGYLPDEGAYTVLQRLPGLRVDDAQTNTRIFIDDDLVDAARAGDVYRWIENPHPDHLASAMTGWKTLIGDTGLRVLQHRLAEAGLDASQVQTALLRLRNATETMSLQAEMVRLLLSLGSAPIQPVWLADLHIPSIFMDGDVDASSVSLNGCIIEVLDVGNMDTPTSLPTFINCAIELVQGVAGIDELARERLIGTEISAFSESASNAAAILRLDLPDYTRVALTLLRKIYVQSGHSRKEGALYRGALTEKQKKLIPKVLSDLQSAGAIRKTRKRDTTLWESNRAMSKRVREALDRPITSADSLITPG